MHGNNPLIEFDGNKVIKYVGSSENALQTMDLYNSFEHHVRASAHGSMIVYDYIVGQTLHSALNSDPESAVILMPKLARYIFDNHQGYITESTNYARICADRQLVSEEAYFTTSPYCKGKIHGDLNTRNIIVTKDQDIVFIDRLVDHGDIMFDFTFVMSLMCLFEASRDRIFLKGVRSFLTEYLSDIDDKRSFLASFRNNFINYGVYVKNDVAHHDDFPEWQHGGNISLRLRNDIDYFHNILEMGDNPLDTVLHLKRQPKSPS